MAGTPEPVTPCSRPKHRGSVSNVMKETIENRKKGAKRGDFVDLLLEAREISEDKQEEDIEEDNKKKFSKCLPSIDQQINIQNTLHIRKR